MWQKLTQKEKQYIKNKRGHCARCGGDYIVKTPHGFVCAVDGGRVVLKEE